MNEYMYTNTYIPVALDDSDGAETPVLAPSGRVMRVYI